jgi:hypothetical protein
MILLNGTPYTPGTPFTNDEGTQFPGNWYSSATPEQRLLQGFTEVADPPQVDQRFYYVNTDGSIAEKPLEQCKQVVVSELANLRWSKENEGIIYNTSNALFQTDSSSRVNYLGVLEIAKANAQYSTVWKARDSVDQSKAKFVTISANDIIHIYYSGMDYISKCFDNEKNIVEQIDSSTVVTLNDLLAINTNANWPLRNY